MIRVNLKSVQKYNVHYVEIIRWWANEVIKGNSKVDVMEWKGFVSLLDVGVLANRLMVTICLFFLVIHFQGNGYT